ncbi:MAG: hypothetical protein Q9227_001076 [Pyrenula ochraceoflavens]
MAAVEAAPGLPGAHHKDASELSLNTIPDPRSASTTDLSRSGSASPRHPDLSNEVATLSDKLISAINHQSSLDETLSHTRSELEASRARIRQLEAESRSHIGKLASGALLTKATADNDKVKLMADLAEERKQKSILQQEKRGIEQELETLTASLFEEANKMVAAANHDRDAVERRNQQLRDQIQDTETLLQSQQEQLTELKLVMQEMSADREEADSSHASTTPSSPGVHREDTISRLLDAMNISTSNPNAPDFSPAPATSYTHLLKPVCRFDTPAYDDFQQFITMSLKSRPSSRVVSGSYTGSQIFNGLNSGTTTPNDSASSLSIKRTSTGSSATPASMHSSPVPTATPLKETKFYKRIMTEDIEPALRLDAAPGVSWLTRRSIMNAICDGTLVVEPIPDQSRKLYGRFTACSCCGESRKGDVNARTHRMKLSENESSTKWPLCGLCLEKFRATCDLVGFIRMVKDGVVRIGEDDKDAEQEAWEELVRLRERLFWARLCAGVVPAFISDRRSDRDSPVPRPSQDSIDAVVSRNNTDEIDFAKVKKMNEAAFKANKRISVGSSTTEEPQSLRSTPATSPDTDSAEEASTQLKAALRESLAENAKAQAVGEESDSYSPAKSSIMKRIGRLVGDIDRPNSSVDNNMHVSIPGGFE